MKKIQDHMHSQKVQGQKKRNKLALHSTTIPGFLPGHSPIVEKT